MAGYEYGNARLRAMRSRLLSQAELNGLAEATSLAELIGLLARTSYRKAIEISLVQSSDLESIDEALRRDFTQTVSSIRSFYSDDERELVDLFLRAYDIHNLKTVLRGLSHQSHRSEIERSLLPVGELSAVILNELLRATSPRMAIDLLATIRHPFAQPLLVLRAEQPGADLFEMELALDRWRYRETVQRLKARQDGVSLARAAINLEADIANLLVVLRFLHSAEEQQFLKQRAESGRMNPAGPERLFNGAGSLAVEQLARLYGASSVKAALALLPDVSFAPALREGLKEYERLGRLSEIERALRRYQLRWLVWQIAKDPLGIGVFLGYLALKNNEVANLRRIARSVQLRRSPEDTRGELEFA